MKAGPRDESKRLYVVVTGDIVSSRKLDPAKRRNLQLALSRKLKDVNRQYRKDMLVDFSISVGDEFQGVLNLDKELLPVIDALQEKLRPARVRFGVGIGTVSTEVRRRSQEMDGEAFVFAREAINKAKKEPAYVWFRTSGPSFDDSANAICLLMKHIKDRWTSKQLRRVALKRAGWNDSRIASAESVRQQAVNESLRHSGYPAVRFAEEALASLVKETFTTL